MKIKISGQGRVGKEGATIESESRPGLTRGYKLQLKTEGNVLHTIATKRLIRIPGTNRRIGPVVHTIDQGSIIRPGLLDAGTPRPDRFEVQAVKKRFGITIGDAGGTMSGAQISELQGRGFKVQVKAPVSKRG